MSSVDLYRSSNRMSIKRPDTVAALIARGHLVISNETMGSAQSIMLEGGLFLGGADPRRPGALAVEP